MPGGVPGNADQDAKRTQAKADNKLSADQVYSVARQAGFNDSLAHTMVAIAWDESSFKANVVNSIGCVGLWQIHPVHFKEAAFKANGWNTTTLKEPHNNARAAKVVYDQQGLNAWTTYKKGLSDTARSYAAQAQDPATAPDLSRGNPDGGIDIPNPLSGITGVISGAFNQLASQLKLFGLNLGGITLALTLLILGVVILLRAPIGATVRKTTPVGKVASLANKVA
jgi:hypothetical protein